MGLLVFDVKIDLISFKKHELTHLPSDCQKKIRLTAISTPFPPVRSSLVAQAGRIRKGTSTKGRIASKASRPGS